MFVKRWYIFFIAYEYLIDVDQAFEFLKFYFKNFNFK